MGHTKIRLKVGRHRKFQRIPWEDIPKDECLIFLTQKIYISGGKWSGR